MYYDKAKTLPVFKGVMVHTQEQYEEMVATYDSKHSVANKPKMDKKGIIEPDAFPFIIQRAWLPVCGYFVCCHNTGGTHLYYDEYEVGIDMKQKMEQ